MGAVLDAGMAAKDVHTLKALRSKGIIPFAASSALAGLDYQLRNNITEMVYFVQFYYSSCLYFLVRFLPT